MNLNDAMTKVSKFIKTSGELALNNWNNLEKEIHIDGVDVTTNTDKEIEKNFSEFVASNFPEAGFKGEEFAQLNKDAEYVWQIDPIDGTKFYAQGIPFWTITIALTQNNEPIMGLVYYPVSNQLYTAIKNEGAYLNGKKIQVNQETNLQKIQISLDLAFSGSQIDERKDKVLPMLESIYKSVYRVRTLGSGAISLAWLAQGFFGAYVSPYRPSNKFVDIYGGMIIAMEAGASVYKSKIPGEDMYNFILGNKEVVDQLIPLLGDLSK